MQPEEIKMQSPLLSVIIISHNQRSELRRCVDSVLAQDIPFEYEIILSDDRSTDGTFELAREYAAKYPFITASQCNSDECDPANNSQRSGWNRCNGYKLAKGKYIAHVDADDYFRKGSKVYEKQVMMLEKHPECSIALSSAWWLDEGKSEENGKPWNRTHPYKDGDIFTVNDFINHSMFIINQVFMQKRNHDVNPVELYGRRYVDSVITYHHMQFGKVVYVEACDYVYVQHKNSVVGQMVAANNDTDVLWCLGIYISALMPVYWSEFLKNGKEYWSIRRVIDLALTNYKLQEKTKKSIGDLNVFIYKCFCKKINCLERCRLQTARQLMKFMKRSNLLDSRFFAQILKKLIF